MIKSIISSLYVQASIPLFYELISIKIEAAIDIKQLANDDGLLHSQRY